MKVYRRIAVLFFLFYLAFLSTRFDSPTQAATPTELFFSEYIEGTSNNKALEIYNGTGEAINLLAGAYDIQVYFNGSAVAGLTIPLTGSVASGDVYVVAHSSASPPILGQADQTNGSGWYNGDDTVVLRKNKILIDVIGRIGFDPGTEWGAGDVSTEDNTLQKKFTSCQGDPNGTDAFDPALDWDGYATDTFAGLGVHTADCSPAPVLVNEVDADQGDVDAAEFIEIYDRGMGSTDLSGFVVVLFDGLDDLSYQAISLQNKSTNLDGYFVICGDAGVVGVCDLQVNQDFLVDGPAAVAVYAGTANDFPNGTPVTTNGLVDAYVYDTGALDDPGLLVLLNPGQPQVNENYNANKDAFSSQRCPNGSGGARNTSTFGQFPPTPGVANACVFEIGACGDPALTVHTLQGSGAASLFAGQGAVIEGVVVGDFQDTAKGLKGFFLQEENSDADGSLFTSEGIFVFDNGYGVDVNPGQVVRVLGKVSEYYGLTELSDITGLVVCPYQSVAASTTVTMPVTTLSDWERWEGMLVTLPQTLHATENYSLGRYGEVDLSIDGRLYVPTQIVAPGSTAVQQQNVNDRSRIQLDDGSNVQNPLPLPPYLGADKTLRLGDSVTGLTGVLSYSYSRYEIHPTQTVSFTRVNQRVEEPPAMLEGSLKILSTNLLNYFTTLDEDLPICGPSGTLDCRGANTVNELARQRDKILRAFLSMEPDVAGLVEIENNATAAIQSLVDGLNAMFGPGTYAYINTGTIGTDAIKVAIIYKPGKVTPVGLYKILDSSVDPDFIDTRNRPSLAQTFVTPAGEKYTVVVNHLKSKGSSCSDIGDPDTGDGQGNCNLTRVKAANALIDWLATDPTGSGDSDFLLLGDFNSYAMEDPIIALKNAGFVNLVETAEGSQAYSYSFEGQSGTLDYALASPSLAKQIGFAYELHVNADEPSALDYNDYNQPGLYTPDIYRYADHDPILVTISPWKVTQVGNELQIGYLQGDGYPQYAVLHLSDSYFRMNYGLLSGWGTSLVLMPAFWSGGNYYQGTPVTAAHRLVNNDLELSITGNNNGLQVVITLTLKPPRPGLFIAEVQGMALISVPIDNDRPGEAFKPVFLSSMHISPEQWDASEAFASTTNVKILIEQGWLIAPTPPVIETSFGLWGGTSEWKTNAPTIRVELDQPLQIAGWVTGSSNPDDDNIGLWAASDDVMDAWSYTVTASNALPVRYVYLPVINR